MSKIFAVFPGQGSQYPGMGRVLFDTFSYTKKIFEEAEDACKLKIRALCFNGSEEDLKQTEVTQPCLLTVCYAYWHVLQQEVGFEADLFAGHSLGEYTALVASSKLSYARAVYLARERGALMQSAVPSGLGGMIAVLGGDPAQIETLCRDISRPHKIVEMANYNSPGQLVVAGHISALDEMAKHLDEQKIKYVRLKVSAPFHSSLMKPVREKMAELIYDTPFIKNDKKVLANISGLIEDYTADHLIKQIDSSVKWMQSLQNAESEGIEMHVEIGCQKVLTGLAKRTFKTPVQLMSTDDIKLALTSLKK